jgi:uncharacterized protein
MFGTLPASIDPIQLAERGARLTGTLPLKSMPRLVQACLDGSGDVHVDLSFERSEGEGLYEMRGDVSVKLRVTCQRCLEEMDFWLEARPSLMLMRPGSNPALLELEADVMVVDKPLLLSSVVEDELLLAMPMVPLHGLNECPGKVYVAGGASPVKESGKAGKVKKNPFSVLSELKRTK